MFPLFRKEDRSQLSKEQVPASCSMPAEDRKESEAASSASVSRTSMDAAQVDGLPATSQPQDASLQPLATPARPRQAEQAATIVASQPAMSTQDNPRADDPATDNRQPGALVESGASQIPGDEMSNGDPEHCALDVGTDGAFKNGCPGNAGSEHSLPADNPADLFAATDRPRLSPPRRGKGRRLAAPAEQVKRHDFTAEQRLLLLDTWRRSGLPAGDFAPLVGVSKHTLYAWRKRFEEHGPAGLEDQPRGAKKGSRLPELTKRTILMLKESHPEWGCQRISDMLARGPALPASASAVARVLHEAGYELIEEPTRPHPDKVRRFERAKPNQLWQTDLFTFVLKRQNRRVYLVAFMDDHSRFIVSYGLHASQSTALVLEVLEAGIASYGPPEEILTDNGAQYVTWRGKSQFTKRLEKRGIRQIVAKPKRPQTLGKIERFWGTLWRERSTTVP